MRVSKRLSQVLQTSKEIPFDDTTKIIIISDCHRGDNSRSDNFAKNKNIYLAALRYYLKEDYIYIEIGDGDELWENKYLSTVINNHIDVFTLLSKFYRKKRLYMLFGNHDIIKRNRWLRKNIMREFYDEKRKKYITLFPHIEIDEGLILRYNETGDTIFLTHGHQGDFFNDNVWKLTRFLVRYVWKPLELIGVRNPTSAATNHNRQKSVEKKLISWSIKNKQMIIAGHTHRAVIPEVGEHLYFNDGCCTHPRHITCIEIVNGEISLVKWDVKFKENRTLYIDREIISGPTKLKDYFDSVDKLSEK
ncbi:MAG TPA: serine/threonine protein phosphatase [Mollicutes bacterium]|nr:serine/threonine protein phosphatase [Mollicutes bacterium]